MGRRTRAKPLRKDPPTIREGIKKRVRLKFEWNYDSCNWGYIADFDVIEILGNKFFYLPKLKKNGLPEVYFFEKELPDGFMVLAYEDIEEIRDPLWLDCTGNEKWCEDNASIDDIIKWHKEN